MHLDKKFTTTCLSLLLVQRTFSWLFTSLPPLPILNPRSWVINPLHDLATKLLEHFLLWPSPHPSIVAMLISLR